MNAGESQGVALEPRKLWRNPGGTTTLPNEVAITFLMFLSRALFLFNAWLSLRRNYITYRYMRFHRDDSPLGFWSLVILCAGCGALLTLGGVVYGIVMMRASW